MLEVEVTHQIDIYIYMYSSRTPQSWAVLFVPLSRWEMETHRVKIALLGSCEKSMTDEEPECTFPGSS